MSIVIWTNGIPNQVVEMYDDKNRIHSENGPAIYHPNGDVEYYKYGIRHRENGPAIISATVKEWWVEGKRIKIEWGDKL